MSWRRTKTGTMALIPAASGICLSRLAVPLQLVGMVKRTPAGPPLRPPAPVVILGVSRRVGGPRFVVLLALFILLYLYPLVFSTLSSDSVPVLPPVIARYGCLGALFIYS